MKISTSQCKIFYSVETAEKVSSLFQIYFHQYKISLSHWSDGTRMQELIHILIVTLNLNLNLSLY